MTTQHTINGATIPQFDQGHRMVLALESARIGRGQMAQELGTTTEAIRRWTHGITPPKRHVLIAWATVCQVDLTWLETGELPRLDSNQRPFGYQSPQVRAGVAWGLAA